MSKTEKLSPKKRYNHYNKNAVQMHAAHCYDPTPAGKCFYGMSEKNPDVIAARENDEAVMTHHTIVCMRPAGPDNPQTQIMGILCSRKSMDECTCSDKLQRVDCQAAVDAENASAEIERHLAAIRKIKKRGRPLKGKEAYGVYPK